MEKLTICKHCGSDAAIETQLDEQNKAWLCYTCGFSTSTYHVDGSELINKADETCPQLYKDLKFTDDDNLVWMPMVLSFEKVGMVFLDGTDINDIKWAVILSVEINSEEKHNFPIPQKPNEFYSHKMDASTLKLFDKNEFMEALSYLGYFNSDVIKSLC